MLCTVQQSQDLFTVELQRGRSLSVARIRLDAMGQIESVVLIRQLLSHAQRRLVLQMVAAHVCGYYVTRLDCDIIEPLPPVNPRLPDLTTSHRLLHFGNAPGIITQMDTPELQNALTRAGVELIEGYHHIVETATAAITCHPRFAHKHVHLQITRGERRPYWRGTSMIKVVALPRSGNFTFWRELEGHTPPSEIRGLRRTFLIDSETDLLLNQVRPPVIAVHPPRADDDSETRFHDNLPSAYVEGSSIELEIDPARILSEEAVDFVVSLLACAMGHDNRYISYAPR